MRPQKSGTLCLLKILYDFSDDEHILSMKDILKKLEELYDIKTERRAVYRYINTLLYLGYDISVYDDNGKGYYLRTRIIDSKEISDIIDVLILYSPFSESKTKKISVELMQINSIHNRKDQSNIAIIRDPLMHFGSVNSEIYHTLNSAIKQRSKPCLTFSEHNVDIAQKHKHSIEITPYKIISAAQTYHLIYFINGKAFSCRLDEIKKASILDNKGENISKTFDLEAYSLKHFYGLKDDSESAVVKCSVTLLNEIYKKFGSHAHELIRSSNSVSAIINLPAEKIMPWLMNNIDRCELISPQSLREDIIRRIKNSPYMKDL